MIHGLAHVHTIWIIQESVEKNYAPKRTVCDFKWGEYMKSKYTLVLYLLVFTIAISALNVDIANSLSTQVINVYCLEFLCWLFVSGIVLFIGDDMFS
jgi:F0F1-type ATP synthase assembly protein I